jgi:hypothetical protein
MTGSAKQSIAPRKEKNGLLRRFAPRNDGGGLQRSHDVAFHLAHAFHHQRLMSD